MMKHDDSYMKRGAWKLYGTVGLLIILFAEALLFGGNNLIGRWFTPIIWTGYVLFTDALLFRLHGRSLLPSHQLELLTISIVSIVAW